MNKEREIRQESDLRSKYGKAQHPVGLFYYQNLIRIIRIMLILIKLNHQSGSSLGIFSN